MAHYFGFIVEINVDDPISYAISVNLKRRWAYQLIDASVVIDNVSHAIHSPPTNARQACELARAPKEKQAEVWAEVVAEGEPTAAKVKAAVERIAPRPQSRVARDLKDDCFAAIKQLTRCLKEDGL